MPAANNCSITSRASGGCETVGNWAARGKRPLLVTDLIMDPSLASPDIPKHVVVVMDGLKEFSLEPLEWVLKNIAFGFFCTITLLGVMPWLNIPLSAKTWSDIWSLDIEDLSLVKEKIEWRNDVKYQKIQRLLGLCQKYGVVPEIRTEMGHPLRLLVVEQITSLHASLVVFDRYHDKKNIEYYAEKVPYNMLVMNENGEVDIIKGRSQSHIQSSDNTPVPSACTTSAVPTAKVIYSENIIKKFWPKLYRGKYES